MVYATWRDELAAFEADCDRIRKARRESWPVKILGLAPLSTIPFLGGLGWGRRFVALAGIGISGIGLMMELEKQREAYAGALTIDLNPNSDFDNLASAFRTRSPRWECLAYLYSQLDPIHIKDRLSALTDEDAKRILDRMLKRVRRGLEEIRLLSSSSPGYADVVSEIASEWREDVGAMLDRFLYKAGVLTAEDLDDEAYENEDDNPVEPLGKNGSTVQQDTLTLFDWNELNCYPNHFPHLLLLGKTGAGKTTLAERLLNLLPGDRLLITPHHKPTDFPGVKCIGRGRDYAEILIGLQGLAKEMQARYQLYSEGDESYGWLNVVIDEYPAISANCGKGASEIMMVLAREARKVKIRLLILSQGAEVKALGIEGNGSVRECFTFVRLRGFVEDHARRLKDDAIARFISGQDYPCMVEDQPADTNMLNPVEPLGNKGSTGSESVGSTEAEPMAAWVVDGDVVDAHADEEDNFYIPQLPGIVLTDNAQRMYGWFIKKRPYSPQGWTLRDVLRGKPMGKRFKHNAETINPILSELIGQALITWDAKTGAIAIR